MTFRAFRQQGKLLLQEGKQAYEETTESAIALAKFGVLFYCLHEYCLDITTCIGPSMLPTFNTTGDVVILEKVSTSWPLKR